MLFNMKYGHNTECTKKDEEVNGYIDWMSMCLRLYVFSDISCRSASVFGASVTMADEKEDENVDEIIFQIDKGLQRWYQHCERGNEYEAIFLTWCIDS